MGCMDGDVLERCEFETERLAVGPWHEVADRLDVDLGTTVADLLDVRTTAALPASWRGEYSPDSARGWIDERDAESSMLLITELASQQPIGLLILGVVPLPGSGTDLRIGYLLAEHVWGRGLASELVSGLIEWARTQPAIRTLTGGADPTNRASVRVLEKCGFEMIDEADPDAVVYQFQVSPANEWDDLADEWDDNEAARAYAAAAMASLRRLVSDSELAGARVLDFGCGTGLLTEQLVAAGATVDAVDTSTAMLAVVDAKTATQGWTDVRTSTSLPDDHAAFDLVVCSSVCSFLDDYPATAADLVARLRSGGRFIQWDWERTGDDAHGLTRTEIEQTLSAVGLVDVRVNDAFTVSIADLTMTPIMGHGRR